MDFIGPGGEWGIPRDDYSFLRVGWITSKYEIDQGWDPGPPYEFRLFIDGQEIPMQRWSRNYKDQEVLYPDGEFRIVNSHVWVFFVSFDPYFFELGPHEIRLQMLVHKPYFGSESNNWRFYTNYLTGGGDPMNPDVPTFEDWYGPAGLVWDQYHTLYVF
ncbi:MAG: hypothetical protein P8Y70_18910 [Candidatus Lokiarchaeota archaeon]